MYKARKTFCGNLAHGEALPPSCQFNPLLHLASSNTSPPHKHTFLFFAIAPSEPTFSGQPQTCKSHPWSCSVSLGSERAGDPEHRWGEQRSEPPSPTTGGRAEGRRRKEGLLPPQLLPYRSSREARWRRRAREERGALPAGTAGEERGAPAGSAGRWRSEPGPGHLRRAGMPGSRGCCFPALPRGRPALPQVQVALPRVLRAGPPWHLRAAPGSASPRDTSGPLLTLTPRG